MPTSLEKQLYLTESPAEIRAARLSSGEVATIARNANRYPWVYLLYDFAVDDYRLKPKHEQWLRTTGLKEIQKHAALIPKRRSIQVLGSASRSGTPAENRELAEARAAAVVSEILTKAQGSVLPGSKASIPPGIFSVVGQNDWTILGDAGTTPEKRRFLRSVRIVLPGFRGGHKPGFSTAQRAKALSQINGRFHGLEAAFYRWYLESWEYLRLNPYSHWSRRHEDGLFFRLPPATPSNDRETWYYLRQQYDEFRAASARLRRRYLRVQGSLKRPEPVRAYQQCARWIAMDGWTSPSHSRTRWYQALPHSGTSNEFITVQKSLIQLIQWINQKKYGPPDRTWIRIERYFAKHAIPMKVARSNSS
ncbi:MAG: OmpA family protein [bacterium]|nr:OmpA family protein [bacterium]